MSQRNSDADSNPSGVPRGTSVFREPEVWVVFPAERAAAEIEQPNVSMGAGSEDRAIVTVPRGTECGRRCLRITLCSRCLVFHVEQCGARSSQNLYKNFFVPRETACTSIGTLLNFRHTESWGRFDKNYRGGKSKRRSWKNNYRCKSCGLPRYRGTIDIARGL